jgi:hypothetical protein
MHIQPQTLYEVQIYVANAESGFRLLSENATNLTTCLKKLCDKLLLLIVLQCFFKISFQNLCVKYGAKTWHRKKLKKKAVLQKAFLHVSN